MKRSLSFLISMLCASAALAEPASAPAVESTSAVSALVAQQLVAPLGKAQSKRKRFSRAAPVPAERRVRVLDTRPQTDARGKPFLRFAVDQRFAWDDENAWNEGVFTGCAYLEEAKVFVQQGEAYVPARGVLGKPAELVAGVCRPAPTVAAQPAGPTTAG